MPRPNISTGYAFTTPPGERFSVDWRILRAPDGRQQFYPHTSFWLDAPDGPRADGRGRGVYMGPQRLAGGVKKVIFSVWDDPTRPDGEATPIPLPAGDVADHRLWDNGTGAHTEAPIAWTAGTPYRLAVQHIPAASLWLCACTNLTTGATVPVGLIRAAGRLAAWTMTHYETLGGGPDCAGHGPAVVVWENWQPAVRVVTPYWPGTCPDVLTRNQIGDASTAYVLR